MSEIVSVNFDTPPMFHIGLMFCPLSVAWCQAARGIQWRTLYVFGVRIACWRCD